MKSPYTIYACGESCSVTHCELFPIEASTLRLAFAAVNETAERNDDYSPEVYLFEGHPDEHEMATAIWLLHQK